MFIGIDLDNTLVLVLSASSVGAGPPRALPVEIPPSARNLRDASFVSVFVSLIPQMIVPYADAAAVMLANLDRGNAMSRHRVGLALPIGMQGQK